MRQVMLMAAGLVMMGASAASAATIEIKMLNKGSDGSMMVFEPAFVKAKPGDTIHFVATDKAHNAESIPGMLPEGATAITGKMGEDITVKLDKPGIYGVKCLPHVGMGMVALVAVGKPANEEAAKAASASLPPMAKTKLVKLFAQLDGK